MTFTTSKARQAFTDIDPREFVTLNDPPLLIDVRSQLEYQTGHVPGAVNLSLPRLLLGSIPMLRSLVWPEWFRDIEKDRTVAVICLSAHRSPIAADYLAKQGFDRVWNLIGGMLEWKRLGLETRSGKQP
ncbi:rhodanese-like domain-containing protein [Oxynema aestuarii]|jgi:rhodanese-related sulfurtransferase|uniref:Rhodanese-like domain-containing protein n=1 Tax=Oxynema aestuarii AP17 TaxID=2064643 RepID=A0A6H1TVP4_9CYAN|nr:rhodanese-like domain-containing protein [Oxynema aestuarii]QIZ70678.1 rhodanese-like domain-containing protein [Oxynema aestuarii AP17]RMH77012.1 MAG: rhodanese-like domain-containing protein [Cyanobacteria bacterium J007]